MDKQMIDPLRDELCELPRLLTPREAAEAARRSTRTVRRWLGAGLLRAVRPGGGRCLIERKELTRFLRDGGAS